MGEGWEEATDGYYYYKDILKEGETSTDFISEVTFNPNFELEEGRDIECTTTKEKGKTTVSCTNLESGYAGAKYRLDITIETIQADQKWGYTAGESSATIQFYQPYRIAASSGNERQVVDYVFHEDGSLDAYIFYYRDGVVIEQSSASLPAGSVKYRDGEVEMDGGIFKITPNGTALYDIENPTFILTLIPTDIHYITYEETYVNNFEENYPYFTFNEDGTFTYSGEGNKEGTATYYDEYLEIDGERIAIYPDGSKIAVDGSIFEVGCAHVHTELRNESDTYTGDTYCNDCGELLSRGSEKACEHVHTEIRNQTEEYTGDTYCNDCGELIQEGRSLLITFYIDSTWNGGYTAVEGMTWEEWINSKYGYAWYICTGEESEITAQYKNNILLGQPTEDDLNDGLALWHYIGFLAETSTFDLVEKDDVIIADHIYYKTYK